MTVQSVVYKHNPFAGPRGDPGIWTNSTTEYIPLPYYPVHSEFECTYCGEYNDGTSLYCGDCDELHEDWPDEDYLQGVSSRTVYQAECDHPELECVHPQGDIYSCKKCGRTAPREWMVSRYTQEAMGYQQWAFISTSFYSSPVAESSPPKETKWDKIKRKLGF